MKKTTVIIPNFNGVHFLAPCLEALYEDTQVPFDLIIVDNGSTDESVAYLQTHNMMPDGTPIRLIKNHKNLGFCKAVNQGIEASDTEYVILLNNDTKVMPGFVKALEEALTSEKNAFSVSALMLQMHQPELIDGAGDYYCALGWAFARGKGRKVTSKRYQTRQEVFSACAGAAIYKKEVFQKIGLFDENHFAYLEDLDIGYRANIFGYRNYYEPTARVLHAGSGFSGSRYNEFKTTLASKNSIYLICKNMPWAQILLNIIFLLPGFLVKTVFFCKKGFGKAYLKGLGKGLSFGISKEGRKHKVRFHKTHLKNYIHIQKMLWQGLIHFLKENMNDSFKEN